MNRSVRFVFLAAVSVPAVFSVLPGQVSAPVSSRAAPGGDPAPPRIVGKVADGTPPPVRPRNETTGNCPVLREAALRQAGRTIAIREIAAPPPPVPGPAPPPPDLSDPQVRARIAAAQAAESDIVSRDIVPLSITVYDHSLSFVRWVWRDPETREPFPFAAWLDDDLTLMEGVRQVEYSDVRGRGRRRVGLILGIGDIDTAAASRNPALAARIPDLAAIRRTMRRASALAAPVSAAGGEPPAGLLIVEGSEDNREATALLRALADLLRRERPRLVAAREGREAARRRREAWLKAHPPRPGNVVIRSWEPRPAETANLRKKQ